jgi:hypothetical protein
MGLAGLSYLSDLIKIPTNFAAPVAHWPMAIEIEIVQPLIEHNLPKLPTCRFNFLLC